MKNETPIPNIFRPFRAGRRVDVFLGLKPQAESFCPFGAEFRHQPRNAVLFVSRSSPGRCAVVSGDLISVLGQLTLVFGLALLIGRL